ncbi:MAG: WbqC family protein [Bacteroidetes bacterium]|nr:WbqC family protein [Bacteroidota bacterium]MDA0903075.1 WbqC family protein [Bacteroidota bacterium]MDA1241715.1 WbqC family protein [Bacteroidota bacterium]
MTRSDGIQAVVLPVALFPPHAWFVLGQRTGAVVCIHETYVKQSLRNRLALCGGQGPFNLSLPVHRRNAGNHPCVSDIRFSDRVHPGGLLKTLRTNYGKAPYFDHLAPDLEHWANTHLRPGALLVDAALASTRWTCEWLGWNHPEVSTSYIESSPDVCDMRPKSAWNGCGTDRYPQVFEDRLGYVDQRSILDVVFHVGPEATTLPSRHGNNLIASSDPA